MKISVSHLTATGLIGVLLGVILISGCSSDNDEGATDVTTAPTLSPQALATAAPILNKDRWRPGTGVRNPNATNAVKK